MTQKYFSLNYEPSRILIVYSCPARRLHPFKTLLIGEFSLLGNQSVIHHYLSSTEKAPQDLYVHTQIYTHRPSSIRLGMDVNERVRTRPHTAPEVSFRTLRYKGIMVER